MARTHNILGGWSFARRGHSNKISFDWGPGAIERPAPHANSPKACPLAGTRCLRPRAAHSDEVVGAWTGRVVSAKGRRIDCPSRRSRVRAARKPVSPLGNCSFSLFCLPADYPGASTVESVAGAWRRRALHRADDALSKFPARPPLCRTCLFGFALTGLVLTQFFLYKK